jgi:hypothetical protein
MKVIDLLNKIANGEEVPEKIEYSGIEFSFQHNCIEYINDFGTCLVRYISSRNLNDEVEIIEYTTKENKKIEKFYFSVYQDQKLGGREVIEQLETKINEIIDKINGE